MYTITDGMRPAANVRRDILLTPATWVVVMRRPGISRPMKTAGAPRRCSRSVVRFSAGRNPSASAAFSRAGRPTAAKTSRPTIAPRMVASRSALTMGAASTVSLAMATPAMIKSRSPGAKGMGIPVSSTKTSPAITTMSRSPLRLPIEVMGFMAPLPRTVARPGLADQLADQWNRHGSATQKSIMERLQRVPRPSLHLASQFEDEELAQRVVEIHRIPGAPRRLAGGRQFGHVSDGLEKANGVEHRHPLAMQAERDEESAVAQQRLQTLRQPLFGVVGIADLQHHLFHVVRKTFARGVCPEELTRRRAGVPLEQALDVMTGISLVDRGPLQRRIIHVAQPFLALGGVPVGAGDGHPVIAVGGDRLEWSGAIQGGADIGGVRGRWLDQAAAVARKRDDVAIHEKGTKATEHRRHVGDDRGRGRVVILEARHRGAHAAAGRDLFGSGLRGGAISVDVDANHAFERRDVELHQFAQAQ